MKLEGSEVVVYKIALCDDESEQNQILRLYLEEYFKNNDQQVKYKEYIVGSKLLEEFNEDPTFFNICFLDIDMQPLDGIRLAREIRKINKDVIIIFVSAHWEFSLVGYEVRAYDYIVKPIDPARLQVTLKEICEKIENRKEIVNDKKIVINQGKNQIEMNMNEIIFIEKMKNKLLINCEHIGYEYNMTLSKLLEQLDDGSFIQCHRGYIVNKYWISECKNYQIRLRTGRELTVSRKYFQSVKEFLLDN